MGLDIHAYRNLENTGKHRRDFGDELYDDESLVFFGGMIEWQEEMAYSVEECRDWFERAAPLNEDSDAVYRCQPDDCLHVHMGGYFWINKWRSILSEYAGEYAEDPDAFRELIDFSDCEGVIGLDAARKLLVDFEEHEAAVGDFADKALDGDTRDAFLVQYSKWMEVFGFACSGAVDLAGAVMFC